MGGNGSFLPGSRVFNWIFIAKCMILTLSVAFGLFTKIQPIKERFTTSDHSINTIGDFSDSQSAHTGWGCPRRGGEETSQCFLLKWQKDRPGSSKALPWKDGSLKSGLFQAIWKAAALNECPALTTLSEEIPGSSHSCPLPAKSRQDLIPPSACGMRPLPIWLRGLCSPDVLL